MNNETSATATARNGTTTVQEQNLAGSQQTINVQDFINSHDISYRQMLIVAVCFLTICLDGYSAQSLGFIAPAIRADWKLPPSAMAPIFSMILGGLMIGSFIFGPMADKFGRKVIIMTSVFAFGLFSLLTSFTQNVHQMMAVLFLTGMGLGGAMPNLVTITSEFCPQRKRSFLTTLMFCGFTIGGAGGGILAAKMVGIWGWRSVFVLGGCAPMLLLPVLYLYLPESIRYLVTNGKSQERIARNLQLIAPGEDVSNAKFVLAEQKVTGFPVKGLFAKGLASGTLLLWVAFFINMGVVYFFTMWLPTIVHALGISLSKTAVIASVFLLGGTLGGVSIGLLMDKFNPYKVIITTMLIGGCAIFSLGHVTSTIWLTILCIFIAGIGTSGSQVGLNALTAAFYPTANRATGVSWGLGVGRCGTVGATMLGGLLLAWKWPIANVYLTFAIPMAIAASGILATSKTERARIAFSEWRAAAAAAKK